MTVKRALAKRRMKQKKAKASVALAASRRAKAPKVASLADIDKDGM